MEVDTEQWVLKAAALSMGLYGHTRDKIALLVAFEEMYPEANVLQRYRQQVKEYKKLTMWRD